MNPSLSWSPFTLKMRNPFRLSYGVEDKRQVFLIRLADGSGWGESAIPSYYGVDQNAMIACWEAVAQKRQPLPDEPGEIAAWVGSAGPAPARCALELALYDRIARQRGLPLYA
jgi:L-Ala-D/L-Glu epimerase